MTTQIITDKVVATPTIIEEIPTKDVSLSATPYDDVYRTLVTDCPGLIIPLVNEIFGKTHRDEEEIKILNNEIFLNRQDGNQLERVTDSTFLIENIRYHIECQSTTDCTILLRIFEYDSQLALRDSTVEKETLYVRFPKTAVMYLRHRNTTPEHMFIHLVVPNDECSYQVPVMKVQTYTIDEIFKKKLYFLIPFHIFTYEHDLLEYDSDEQRLNDLKHAYRIIIKKLDQCTEAGYITEYMKLTIIDMSKKVLEHVCFRYANVRKGVREIMGGKVLEYEAKTILRAGARQKLADLTYKKMRKGQSVEQISEILEESEDTIREIIREYKLDSKIHTNEGI